MSIEYKRVNQNRQPARIVYDILDYLVQEPWSKRWRVSHGAYLSGSTKEYLEMLIELGMIEINDKNQLKVTKDGLLAHKAIKIILRTLKW